MQPEQNQQTTLISQTEQLSQIGATKQDGESVQTGLPDPGRDWQPLAVETWPDKSFEDAQKIYTSLRNRHFQPACNLMNSYLRSKEKRDIEYQISQQIIATHKNIIFQKNVGDCLSHPCTPNDMQLAYNNPQHSKSLTHIIKYLIHYCDDNELGCFAILYTKDELMRDFVGALTPLVEDQSAFKQHIATIILLILEHEYTLQPFSIRAFSLLTIYKNFFAAELQVAALELLREFIYIDYVQNIADIDCLTPSLSRVLLTFSEYSRGIPERGQYMISLLSTIKAATPSEKQHLINAMSLRNTAYPVMKDCVTGMIPLCKNGLLQTTITLAYDLKQLELSCIFIALAGHAATEPSLDHINAAYLLTSSLSLLNKDSLCAILTVIPPMRSLIMKVEPDIQHQLLALIAKTNHDSIANLISALSDAEFTPEQLIACYKALDYLACPSNAHTELVESAKYFRKEDWQQLYPTATTTPFELIIQSMNRPTIYNKKERAKVMRAFSGFGDNSISLMFAHILININNSLEAKRLVELLERLQRIPHSRQVAIVVNRSFSRHHNLKPALNPALSHLARTIAMLYHIKKQQLRNIMTQLMLQASDSLSSYVSLTSHILNFDVNGDINDKLVSVLQELATLSPDERNAALRNFVLILDAIKEKSETIHHKHIEHVIGWLHATGARTISFALQTIANLIRGTNDRCRSFDHQSFANLISFINDLDKDANHRFILALNGMTQKHREILFFMLADPSIKMLQPYDQKTLTWTLATLKNEKQYETFLRTFATSVTHRVCGQLLSALAIDASLYEQIYHLLHPATEVHGFTKKMAADAMNNTIKLALSTLNIIAGMSIKDDAERLLTLVRNQKTERAQLLINVLNTLKNNQEQSVVIAALSEGDQEFQESLFNLIADLWQKKEGALEIDNIAMLCSIFLGLNSTAKSSLLNFAQRNRLAAHAFHLLGVEDKLIFINLLQSSKIPNNLITIAAGLGADSKRFLVRQLADGVNARKAIANYQEPKTANKSGKLSLKQQRELQEAEEARQQHAFSAHLYQTLMMAQSPKQRERLLNLRQQFTTSDYRTLLEIAAQLKDRAFSDYLLDALDQATVISRTIAQEAAQEAAASRAPKFKKTTKPMPAGQLILLQALKKIANASPEQMLLIEQKLTKPQQQRQLQTSEPRSMQLPIQMSLLKMLQPGMPDTTKQLQIMLFKTLADGISNELVPCIICALSGLNDLLKSDLLSILLNNLHFELPIKQRLLEIMIGASPNLKAQILDFVQPTNGIDGRLKLQTLTLMNDLGNEARTQLLVMMQNQQDAHCRQELLGRLQAQKRISLAACEEDISLEFKKLSALTEPAVSAAPRNATSTGSTNPVDPDTAASSSPAEPVTISPAARA